MVGQNGLEPSTSRLSVVCSSQLSYWPISAHFFWWRLAGSNRWPPACKAGALPAELNPHISSLYNYQTLKTIRNGNSSARSLSSSSRRCASLCDLLSGIRACTFMLRCFRSSFDDQVPRSSAFASARFLARIDLGMNPPISLRVAP